MNCVHRQEMTNYHKLWRAKKDNIIVDRNMHQQWLIDTCTIHEQMHFVNDMHNLHTCTSDTQFVYMYDVYVFILKNIVNNKYKIPFLLRGSSLDSANFGDFVSLASMSRKITHLNSQYLVIDPYSKRKNKEICFSPMTKGHIPSEK